MLAYLETKIAIKSNLLMSIFQIFLRQHTPRHPEEAC